MRAKPLLLPILAASISAGFFAAGIAWAGRQPAEQADRTGGMALMSAVVDAEGNLVRGAGVTDVERTASGIYSLTFARNVEACTIVATVVETGLGPAFPLIFEQSGANVIIETFSPAIIFTNRGFQAIAFCDK